MSTPTTHMVIRRLSELSLMLEAATTEVAELDEAAVMAKSVNEVAYAKAFLGGTGAMDLRKQQALLDTADERLGMEIAEQKVRACRERIRTIRDQIEVGRSLNSAVRAEWTAGAVGQS